MKTVGIVGNSAKTRAPEVALDIARRLRRVGVEVFFEEDLARLLPGRPRVSRWRLEENDSPEVLIVLGGDGTMISTFRRQGSHSVPMLGINLGGLGFLTEVPLDGVAPALVDLVAGRMTVRRVHTLGCRCLRRGRTVFRGTAVNEAVIGRGGMARVIRMEAFLDGRYLTEYQADGLIVATPTGSTAYSLSAAGPILGSGLEAFVVNPICPHSLTNRPLVIPSRGRLNVIVRTAVETWLTLDGQVGYPLEPGDEIGFSRGRRSLRLLSPPGESYYHILRRKLGWAGTSLAGKKPKP